MTNEIEKTFFDTLGIRAYYKYLLIDKIRRYRNEKLFDKTNFIDFVKSGKDYLLLKVIKYYPKITDRILLELICIINQIDLHFYNEDDYFTAFNYKNLKEEVISKCKRLADKNALSEVTGKHIKQQVQTLFEEVQK